MDILDDLERFVVEGQIPHAHSRISHKQWVEYLDEDRECYTKKTTKKTGFNYWQNRSDGRG